MIKKLGATLTTVAVALLGSTLASPSAHASADPYQARVPTSTTVTVPGVVRADTAVDTRVVVRANGAAPSRPSGRAAAAAATGPTGKIRLTYTRVGGGFRATMTKPYTGRAIRFAGPELPKVGRYTVRAVYVPADDSTYRSSSDTDASRVGTGGPDGPGGPGTGTDGPGPSGGTATDGLLPDTGGPDVRWLLLGLLLVGSGIGLLVAGRERRSPYLV